MHRTTAVAPVTVVLTLIGLAAPAAAAAPVRVVFDDRVESVLEGTCAFDVAITSVFTDTVVTTFADRNGETTRIALKITEQDTFTANGKTLVGLPYRFNTQIVLDDEGEIERVTATGVAARIPLPSGDVLLAAGRIDAVAHDFGFVIVPDQGTPVDIDAFCSALS